MRLTYHTCFLCPLYSIHVNIYAVYLTQICMSGALTEDQTQKYQAPLSKFFVQESLTFAT